MADPTQSSSPIFKLLLLLIIPVIYSTYVYQTDNYNAGPLPEDHSFETSISVPEWHDRILAKAQRIGEGLLHGPEDLAYDPKSRFLYTGCLDGWIRRVDLADDGEFKVENWVQTGEHGRPLGVVLGLDGSLIIADAYEGLLKVSPDKEVEVLVDEAKGVKFGITDGVDVASDGTIYFTDASYKYRLDNHMFDILEARPHGRLMSFDPSSNETIVLLQDLYFANGVAVAPDQKSLIYCETVLRRCRRYYIQGEKKGINESFIDNLPGYPDNIRYDGEGHYWIGLSAGRTMLWDIFFKYPILRSILYVADKFVTVPKSMKNSGVLGVSLDGQPVALYSDPNLILVTGGLKIGNYLYYGSLYKSYISRIDLTQTKIPEK
ncbi:Calcium-dependent phosphotriesterase superfamily protein [Rhynchospora pubera]|uniref:Calcium-dependent phosphotriesterase superfamily protein n=1 Tax=Rhynchospora pubera TaxID=906938 RepID=A0AAV8GGY0_9POAL|nr:Calcium-dependent phosphotriesterase superfamily protein [Rhynchospora pubera]KAJ4802920.1 Calcium-dependent phosphotriesterase superfamily protein [Rhynchospora pubera]